MILDRSPLVDVSRAGGRSLLIVSWLLLCWNSGIASAQVLDLDRSSSASEEVIELTGELVELKKYSFALRTETGDFRVSVPRNTPIFVELDRPRFELSKNRVWVVPFDAGSADEGESGGENGSDALPTSGETPRAVALELPDPLFLTTRFSHETQMTRILGAPVVRLNNYTLLSANPGYQFPLRDEEILVLVGKVEPGPGEGQTTLVVEDRRMDLVLGHRGAVLAGLTLAELDPKRVRLKIKGVLADDQEVVAREIKVLPVAPDQPNRP